MKIKIIEKSYEDILKIPEMKRKKPFKQNIFWRKLLQAVSYPTMKKYKFKLNKIGMEKLGKKEPAVYLMNHSSFTDMKIAASILADRRYNIVTSMDAFIGMDLLLRLLGCIMTQKFVSDLRLIKDMIYAIKELKSSVLMYPEACYTIDGTATTIPDSLGKCIKLLGVPFVMITTYGAFLRDPLYNNLQIRKVDISADMEYVLSKEDIERMSADEINEVIREKFSFDNFKWQQENNIEVKSLTRADGLNRVLYKCPHCLAEGKTVGEGTTLKCTACGKEYELTEKGFMKAKEGQTEFSHIPDWYKWERECVKEEIEKGTYELCDDVDLYMLIDTKGVYKAGEAKLIHNQNGFTLEGFGGKLNYRQSAKSYYSLYCDFNWYEIGDVIVIGNNKMRYCCVPKNKRDVVAKARLATEEIYKKAVSEKNKM
ncbi:MAG: hypothetical protein E7564_05760 [Ruminococcaceae bacterium]|nr:hypothetical protein [Oscillospiraceae bacterium]